MWAKGIALGVLAYFIALLDAIPDVTPIVGFTDDAGAIAVTFGNNITDEHKDQARMNMLGEHYIK